MLRFLGKPLPRISRHGGDLFVFATNCTSRMSTRAAAICWPAINVRALRDGLLGLPDRLASTLAAETDQRKVHVLLKAELNRELEALSHALGSE